MGTLGKARGVSANCANDREFISGKEPENLDRRWTTINS